MLLTPDCDPMGAAIGEFHSTGDAAELSVLTLNRDEEDDELPVDLLFRPLEQMNRVETTALQLASGKVLDVGAGAGCHSLVLAERGVDVTPIDISPLAVATMRARGLSQSLNEDLFDHTGRYDTILMLMNGIGIIGNINALPRFFAKVDTLLTAGGQLLCDSSDFLFDYRANPQYYPADDYFGHYVYRMKYRDITGNPFDWLYIDRQTLCDEAERHGFKAEIILTDTDHNYLARITRYKKP